MNAIVIEYTDTWECSLFSSCKSGLRTTLGDDCRTLRTLFPWISLLLLFGLAGGGAAKAGEIKNGPATRVGPGPQFAIADFDGDLQPDMASIQAGGTSGTSSYWIQLQLSAAGRQSIQLFAPAGGLVIEARDVNGDHAIDLVFTTAWFRQPVAVLLNDGHGSFSRAEPSAFPEAFSKSRTNWVSGTNQATDIVGIPPQSGAGIEAEEKNSFHERSPAGLIPPARAGFPVSAFLVSSAGRAPPSKVPHF
jgi:hypothetical protein